MSRLATYRFEEIGPDLDLVPIAGRRALDAAGRKASLEAWRALPLPVRTAIVDAGTAERVDAARVHALLAGVETTDTEGRPDPDAERPPAALDVTLRDAGLVVARWPSLRALDRWALAMLASRGRAESLRLLIREIS